MRVVCIFEGDLQVVGVWLGVLRDSCGGREISVVNDVACRFVEKACCICGQGVGGFVCGWRFVPSEPDWVLEQRVVRFSVDLPGGGSSVTPVAKSIAWFGLRPICRALALPAVDALILRRAPVFVVGVALC